jgi:hypothetical protein
MRYTEDGEEFSYVPLADVSTLGRSFLFDRPIRFREGMARGIQPNTWLTDDKKLQLLPIDMKRNFYPDGTSRAFTIEEVNRIRPPWAGVAGLPYYEYRDRGMKLRKAE